MSEESKAGGGGRGGKKKPDKFDVDKMLDKYTKRSITPFMAGYDIGTTKKKGVQTKSLLKRMLAAELTVGDLPTKMADQLRKDFPGFFDDVERKFTMSQIVEMIQFKLLFAKSDYVRQNAIEAIKNRVEGKPMQKLQVEEVEVDPTEFVLSNGRKLAI